MSLDLDLDFDIFADSSLDLEGSDLSIESIDVASLDGLDGVDDFSLDELVFETLDDDISMETSEVDNIDYAQLINNLKSAVIASKKTMANSAETTNIAFDLPLRKNDFSLLSDAQFHVLYEFVEDLVKGALKSNSQMPNFEEVKTDFLKLCEEISWHLGLYRDEFLSVFEEMYECTLNELDSYRAAAKKEKASVFNLEDIESVDMTEKAIASITDFPRICADIFKSLDNINLEVNISKNTKQLSMDKLAGYPINTIQELLDVVNDILHSPEVHELLLEKMNADCSMVSVAEIIRLMLVSDENNYAYLLDLPEDTLDKEIFLHMQERLQQDSTDYFAFVILAVFITVLLGSVKTDIMGETLVNFVRTYYDTAVALTQNECYKTPAFITEVSFKNDSMYIECSKGAENYLMTDDFYLIAGTVHNMVKTPIVIPCSCEHRNCRGCLFPPNIFISQMIDWTNEGILETKKSNAKIKFKTLLSPKELSKLKLTVNLEDTEKTNYSVSQEMERWFLNFQEYIQNNFEFREDGYEPNILQYHHSGEIGSEMLVPGYLEGDSVDIDLTGIEMFHSREGSSYKLISLQVGDTVIDNGDIAVDSEKIFISYFVDGDLSRQYLELPLDGAVIAADNEDNLGNCDATFNIYDVIKKPAITILPEEKANYIKRIAMVLSELTGNAFDFLEEKARNILIGNYGNLLEFDKIENRILCYILSSYRDWLDGEEYVSDVTNYSMLRSLLAAIQGDKHILSDCVDAKQLTPEKIDQIKDMMVDSVEIGDIAEKWEYLDQDLLANVIVDIEISITEEQYDLYNALLYVPSLKDFLLSLQYRIVIALICMDKDTRFPMLFAYNTKLAKSFKVSGVPDIKVIKDELKKFKNNPTISTTESVIGLDKQELSDNLSLLRAFILNKNIFGICNTLVSIGANDMLEMFLTEMKAPKNMDRDYFAATQNETEFNDIVCELDIDHLYESCYDKLLNFVYEGAKQDIITHNQVRSVLAYDLLISLYSELGIDFDMDDCEGEEEKDKFLDLLASLTVTYCCVTGEAICDTQENKNRAIMYREMPECFPMMTSIAGSFTLRDLLYVSGGD